MNQEQNQVAPQTLGLHAEWLDGATLSLEEVARICRERPEWVRIRVAMGVFEVDEAKGEVWHFSSRTLVRARRVAELERNFDADPQLAALTVDLIEEVLQLRLQMQRISIQRAAGSSA
jgi:chaperone modulatory protein CbpM